MTQTGFTVSGIRLGVSSTIGDSVVTVNWFAWLSRLNGQEERRGVWGGGGMHSSSLEGLALWRKGIKGEIDE